MNPAADTNTNTNTNTNTDTETPRQEPPRTCTRTSPHLQQGYMGLNRYMFCITPINHVHNLDMALNSSNASLINYIRNSDVDLKNLPTNHLLWYLFFQFQEVLHEEDIEEMSYMIDCTKVNDLIALCSTNDDQFIGVVESERNFMKQLLTNLYALQKQNMSQWSVVPAALPANVLNPQPTGNFFGTKIYNLESEIATRVSTLI